MRISFDLDGTLICHDLSTPRENKGWFGLFFGWSVEPLRKETRALMRKLRDRGCNVWVYTTSERTGFQIRYWLRCYGIQIDGIVNGERHRHHTACEGLEHPPSKYPPAFGIDLHIDDSEGVRIEGEKHGFRVLVVPSGDKEWANHVLAELDKIF